MTHESPEPSNNHQTTTKEPSLSAVGILLKKFGIEGSVLIELLDRELSEEFVKSWIRYANDHKKTIRDPQGFLVAKLRAGNPPPNNHAEKQRWFTDEEYKQYFEHPGSDDD